jgi:Na+/melibiose symporter-like transporter
MSSATSLFEKVSTAFGPLLVGLMLSAANFDKSKADIRDQPASAIAAIEFSLVWTALIVMIVIQIVFWRYNRARKREQGAGPHAVLTT